MKHLSPKAIFLRRTVLPIEGLKMVHFKWFGQACFEIRNSNTIVTDPHDGEGVGLKAPDTEGDIITVSHGHFDHAGGKDLVKKPDSRTIQEETGEKTVKGIKIRGLDSYHDKAEGSKRGENTIYIMEIDGFRICHLGDLGHLLSEDKIDEIGEIDILLIPVGGNYTINGREAIKVIENINPNVVIPMHYKIPGLTVDISDEEQFMEKARERGYEIKEKRELDIESIPEGRTVVKLEYST